MDDASDKGRSVVTRTLLGAEAKVNSFGWDQPAILTALVWPDPHALGLVVLPIDLIDPVPQFLEYLAKKFRADPELPAGLLSILPGHFYGIAFVCEAWMQRNLSQAWVNELNTTQTSLADVVGSKEARIVSAVDIRGRAYQISRTRGEEAVAWHEDPTCIPAGQNLENLRQLTLAMVEHGTGDPEQLAALNALTIHQLGDGGLSKLP